MVSQQVKGQSHHTRLSSLKDTDSFVSQQVKGQSLHTRLSSLKDKDSFVNIPFTPDQHRISDVAK